MVDNFNNDSDEHDDYSYDPSQYPDDSYLQSEVYQKGIEEIGKVFLQEIEDEKTAYQDSLKSKERMKYWEVVFTQKLKTTENISINSEDDNKHGLSHGPAIYNGSEIDMKALHDLLKKQGLSDRDIKYISDHVKQSIPKSRESFITPANKIRLEEAKKLTRDLINILSGLAHEDKRMTPYVESLSTYINPIDFLCEVENSIDDISKRHFSDVSIRPAHLRYSHRLAQIWKLKVGYPKVYNESPFVKFISICTCASTDATKQRINRQNMKKLFDHYAPF